MVFLRQEAEDEFTHTQEVDHLGNAEQRGDDQRSAVRPLQEGRGTLVAQDFPAEKDEGEEKRNTWAVAEKELLFCTQPARGFVQVFHHSDFSTAVFHQLAAPPLRQPGEAVN